MVKRIVGYDEDDKVVFDRDARPYDLGVAHKTFGITLSDVFKVVPIFFLIVTVYVNQQNFNIKVMEMISTNSSAIGKMCDTLQNINNYLSSSTGKQFKDGRPY